MAVLQKHVCPVSVVVSSVCHGSPPSKGSEGYISTATCALQVEPTFPGSVREKPSRVIWPGGAQGESVHQPCVCVCLFEQGKGGGRVWLGVRGQKRLPGEKREDRTQRNQQTHCPLLFPPSPSTAPLISARDGSPRVSERHGCV